MLSDRLFPNKTNNILTADELVKVNSIYLHYIPAIQDIGTEILDGTTDGFISEALKAARYTKSKSKRNSPAYEMADALISTIIPSNKHTDENKYQLQGKYEANDEQVELIDTLMDFFDEDNNTDNIGKDIFTLLGMGGVGKSTTVGRAIELNSNTVMVGLAFMHTAKNVLKGMTSTMAGDKLLGISTLDSFFGKNLTVADKRIGRDEPVDKYQKFEGEFSVDVPTGLLFGLLNEVDMAIKEGSTVVMVIDEVSMLNEKHMRQLLAYKRHVNSSKLKIVLMGDYHQLPSVEGNRVISQSLVPNIKYKDRNTDKTGFSDKIADIMSSTQNFELVKQNRQKQGSNLLKVITNLANIVESRLKDPEKGTYVELANENVFTPNISTSDDVIFIENQQITANTFEGYSKDTWDLIENKFREDMTSKFIAYNNATVAAFNTRIRTRLFGDKAGKETLIASEELGAGDIIMLYESGMAGDKATIEDYTNGMQYMVVNIEKDVVASRSHLAQYVLGAGTKNEKFIKAYWKDGTKVIKVELRNTEDVIAGVAKDKQRTVKIEIPVDFFADLNAQMAQKGITDPRKLYKTVMRKYVETRNGDDVNTNEQQQFDTLPEGSCDELTESLTAINYAYALTSYKAQGQTIPNVIWDTNARIGGNKDIDIKSIRNDYTAVSRAKKSLTIIGNRNKLKDIGWGGNTDVDNKTTELKKIGVTVTADFLTENEYTNIKNNLEGTNEKKSIFAMYSNKLQSNGENLDKHAAIVFNRGNAKGTTYKYHNSTHVSTDMVDGGLLDAFSNKVGEKLKKDSTYFNHVLINKFNGTGIGEHTDAEGIYIDENGNVGDVAVLSIGDSKEEHTFRLGFKDTAIKLKAPDNSLVNMNTGKIRHKVGIANKTRYSITFRHVPENSMLKAMQAIIDNPETKVAVRNKANTFFTLLSSGSRITETKIQEMVAFCNKLKPEQKVKVDSYQTGLQYALTNPTHTSPSGRNWVRGDKETRAKLKPIVYKGTQYADVEQAYQKNKDVNESRTKLTRGQSKNYKLMVELMKAKFDANIWLIDELEQVGGLDFLDKVTHQPTRKNTMWETGGKDWFKLALIEAYEENKNIASKKEELQAILQKFEVLPTSADIRNAHNAQAIEGFEAELKTAFDEEIADGLGNTAIEYLRDDFLAGHTEALDEHTEKLLGYASIVANTKKIVDGPFTEELLEELIKLRPNLTDVTNMKVSENIKALKEGKENDLFKILNDAIDSTMGAIDKKKEIVQEFSNRLKTYQNKQGPSVDETLEILGRTKSTKPIVTRDEKEAFDSKLAKLANKYRNTDPALFKIVDQLAQLSRYFEGFALNSFEEAHAKIVEADDIYSDMDVVTVKEVFMKVMPGLIKTDTNKYTKPKQKVTIKEQSKQLRDSIADKEVVDLANNLDCE